MKHTLSTVLIAALCGLTANAYSSVVTLDSPSYVSEAAVQPNAVVTPFTYNGTTVGGPIFNRPNANGNSAPTALSATGTAVAYDVVLFSVSATGTYSFLSTANYDNFLVLYQGTFNAASPLSGALIANDDFPTIGRSGFNYSLTTGTTYSLVTTGFANTSTGTFTNTISAAVPEPSTWGMLGLGTAGAGVLALRRRRAV